MSKVTFHLTGFGPFNGVDDNPTKKLIATLPQYLNENPIPEARVVSFDVFETSAVGALSTLTEMLQQHQVSLAKK